MHTVLLRGVLRHTSEGGTPLGGRQAKLSIVLIPGPISIGDSTLFVKGFTGRLEARGYRQTTKPSLRRGARVAIFRVAALGTIVEAETRPLKGGTGIVAGGLFTPVLGLVSFLAAKGRVVLPAIEVAKAI